MQGKYNWKKRHSWLKILIATFTLIKKNVVNPRQTKANLINKANNAHERYNVYSKTIYFQLQLQQNNP